MAKVYLIFLVLCFSMALHATNALSLFFHSTNKTEDTSPQITDPCKLPLNCSCASVAGNETVIHTVDCTFKNISALAYLQVPNTAVSLNLRGNSFKHIYSYSFYSGERVHALDVSQNQIESISSSAFLAFKNLDRLNLAYNKLIHVGEDVFQGLQGLQFLDLSYNRLSDLYPTDLKPLKNLKELRLERNPLKKIYPDLFKNNDNLQTVNLRSIGLTSLNRHDLYQLTELKTLDISGNGLTAIPVESIEFMGELRHLDLSNNPIKTVPPYAFQGLRSLTSLFMSHMHCLEEVQNYAFSEIMGLKKVDFSYSPNLKTIGDHAFRWNNSGRALDLNEFIVRQANLETLSKDLLKWENLQVVDFEENPWNCDCRLKWMPSMKSVKDSEGYKLRCASPANMKDIPVKKVDPSSMVCTNLASGSIDGQVGLAVELTLGALITAIIILISIMVFLVVKKRYTPAFYKRLVSRHIVEHTP